MIYFNENFENDLNENFYKYLKSDFNIKILHKYKYIYEEAFDHLLNDTKRIFNKNYKKLQNIKFNKYVIQKKNIYFNTIFMKNLYSHQTLINNLKSDSKEFKKRIRLDKLNKIKIYNSNHL